MTWARALLCLALAAGARAQDASLVLRGGRVFLGPGRYASAIAVAGNRVLAVGSDADVAAAAGNGARVVELRGRAVVPGFHDAHVDVMAAAEGLYDLNLSRAADPDEVRRRVAEYAASLPADAWVRGGGFDDALISTIAARSPLDVLASTRPVVLNSASGAVLWVNAEALRRLRLESATGVLRGEPMATALKRLPPLGRAEKLAALRLALARLREKGVTAIDEFPDEGEPPARELLSLWRELAQRGEATTRLVLFGRLDDPAGYVKLRASAFDLPRTRVLLPGLAGSLDGSLAERTASLLEPYFDGTEAKGSGPRWLGFELAAKVRAAHARGLQVSLHAAGDRAVRAALDVCEKTAPKAAERGAVLPRFPCRIEDPEVLAPEDARRLKHPIAAVAAEPVRLVFRDIVSNYYPDRLGDAVKRALPLRSLQDARALVVFGSGWPQRPLSPLEGLYGAVTRQSRDGKPAAGLVPAERLSLDDALEHYAGDPWELAGLGDELGDVRPGRIADLVVLDRDVFKTGGADLLDARVDATVFDGRLVFERSP